MCSLYLPMKRYSLCINFSSTACATIGTTIIYYVYKPDFSSRRSFLPRPEVVTCLPSNRRPCSNLLSDLWFHPNRSHQHHHRHKILGFSWNRDISLPPPQQLRTLPMPSWYSAWYVEVRLVSDISPRVNQVNLAIRHSLYSRRQTRPGGH